MRLADRIIKNGSHKPGYSPSLKSELETMFQFHDISHTETLKSALRKTTPHIDVSNVYYWMLEQNRTINLYDEFPCLLLPWERCWMEFYDHNGTQQGAYISMWNLGAVRDETPVDEYPMWTPEPDTAIPTAFFWQQVEYIMAATIFLKKSDLDVVVGPVIHFLMALNKEGRLLDHHYFCYNQEDDFRSKMTGAFSVCMQAIDFCHCRNVVLDDIVTPPRLHKAQAKKARKRGDSPPVKFNFIRIDPNISSKPNKQTITDHTGAAKPLHIVRGHIAHYGNCCPGAHKPNGLLFGRIAGRIFIPQHVRGNQDAGEIIKDYAVEPRVL